MGTINQFATLIFLFFLCLFIDKIPSKIALTVTFTLNGLILISFIFIQDPSSWFSYLLWGSLSIIKNFMALSFIKFFANNVPKDIRGLLYGILAFIGVVGKMIMFKVTSVMFNLGRYYPMLIIGIVYLAFAIILIILAVTDKWEQKIP